MFESFLKNKKPQTKNESCHLSTERLDIKYPPPAANDNATVNEHVRQNVNKDIKPTSMMMSINT